ncbi:hypothetical protein FKM82_003237 [Ascaphus truei]
MAWNIPQEDPGIDIGDISERKALRKRLKCKTFRWYLVTVYPEMRTYSDNIAYGVLQNSLKTDLCLDQGPETDNIPIVYICHGMTPQNVYYTSNQQLHVGVLSPTVDDDDNRCLVDVNSRPRLIECNYAKAKRMKLYWHFIQVFISLIYIKKRQNHIHISSLMSSLCSSIRYINNISSEMPNNPLDISLGRLTVTKSPPVLRRLNYSPPVTSPPSLLSSELPSRCAGRRYYCICERARVCAPPGHSARLPGHWFTSSVLVVRTHGRAHKCSGSGLKMVGRRRVYRLRRRPAVSSPRGVMAVASWSQSNVPFRLHIVQCGVVLKV